MEKFHAAEARSTFASRNVQNTPASDNFLKLRCRKIARAVARSAFQSQDAKKLTVSDRFLKLRYGKMLRCCGAKHICKYKCTKHLRSETLLEVPMSKLCPTEEIDRLILS